MTTLIAAAVAVWALVIPAQAQHAGHDAQTDPTAQVFEHYEGVRVALSADKLADAGPHAKQLAASVEAVGGPKARAATEAIARATTIADARNQFGELSTILVPKFQEKGIPGARAFMCEMKKRPWMQRGEAVENPYFGKSMLTCGSPLPPK